MRLILIAFALLLVFFLFSRVKLSHTEGCSAPSSVLHIWEIAAGICCGYLPREFATGICRGCLPWEFAGFFVFTSKFFFVYVSKSCLNGGKPFLYMSKTFWFERFFYLLLVVVVAVMGHRIFIGDFNINENEVILNKTKRFKTLLI